MARTVSLYKIENLAIAECKNEIMLDTTLDTELHIYVVGDRTIIRLPYGNKFNTIYGCIVIESLT